jgi:hypothetical protein
VRHIGDHHHHIGYTGTTNGPACIELFPIDCSTIFRFSSQARSALSSCIILSRLPCRMSLMLTAPILTSLSRRKSKSVKSPSSLSSSSAASPRRRCPRGGNALSGTKELLRPLTDSAMRRSSRPPQMVPVLLISSVLGKWLFAHSIRSGSTDGFCFWGGHKRDKKRVQKKKEA